MITPKISIIVPIYKVEPYINRCVDSILNQTFEDFECILVDDGSPDNCGKICDEYAKKDDRVVVIHKENGGLSDARNAGLEIVKGDYIYFLDGDDYVECNMLEVLHSNICNSNADLIAFGYRNEFVDCNKAWNVIFSPSEYSLGSEKKYLYFVCEILMPYKMGWEAWNKIYKTSIIKENGLTFYNNSQIYAEDLHFFLCYALSIKKIKVIEDVLYHYIRRENSITGLNKDTKINEFVKLNSVLYNYIKKKRLCYLLKNYYIIFYFIMKNRYSQSNYYDVLADMNKVENKCFLRKNLIKIIVNSKKILLFNHINRKDLIFENTSYLLHTGNSFLFRWARFSFRKVLCLKKYVTSILNKLLKKNIY